MTTKKKEDKPISLHEGLAYIQARLSIPKERDNKSFGGFKYRNAEDILTALKPLLAEVNGTLKLEDEIVEVGGRVYVKSVARLTIGTTDQWVENTGFAREALSRNNMDESQLTGAASSYSRKYCLAGMFAIDSGIPDADDLPKEEHRFKPGEQERIITAVNAAIMADSFEMLTKAFGEGYEDLDPLFKMKIHHLFDSPTRKLIKQLQAEGENEARDKEEEDAAEQLDIALMKRNGENNATV